MTQIFHVGDIAKRADSGVRVEILEVIPNGLRLFYRVQECETEKECYFRPEQLRPAPKGEER